MRIVTIPIDFLKLCASWHSGQSSMMYAVASSEDLLLGTDRPMHEDEQRPMTDEEWYIYLWECLELEVRDCIKIAKGSRNVVKLKKFQFWIQGVLEDLKGN